VRGWHGVASLTASFEEVMEMLSDICWNDNFWGSSCDDETGVKTVTVDEAKDIIRKTGGESIWAEVFIDYDAEMHEAVKICFSEEMDGFEDLDFSALEIQVSIPSSDEDGLEAFLKALHPGLVTEYEIV
jgi:hypothetical protein